MNFKTVKSLRSSVLLLVAKENFAIKKKNFMYLSLLMRRRKREWKAKGVAEATVLGVNLASV